MPLTALEFQGILAIKSWWMNECVSSWSFCMAQVRLDSLLTPQMISFRSPGFGAILHQSSSEAGGSSFLRLIKFKEVRRRGNAFFRGAMPLEKSHVPRIGRCMAVPYGVNMS